MKNCDEEGIPMPYHNIKGVVITSTDVWWQSFEIDSNDVFSAKITNKIETGDHDLVSEHRMEQASLK